MSITNKSKEQCIQTRSRSEKWWLEHQALKEKEEVNDKSTIQKENEERCNEKKNINETYKFDNNFRNLEEERKRNNLNNKTQEEKELHTCKSISDSNNVIVDDAKINDLLTRASETILRERTQNKLLNDKVTKVKRELLQLYSYICLRPHSNKDFGNSEVDVSHIKKMLTHTLEVIDESFTHEQVINKVGENECRSDKEVRENWKNGQYKTVDSRKEKYRALFEKSFDVQSTNNDDSKFTKMNSENGINESKEHVKKERKHYISKKEDCSPTKATNNHNLTEDKFKEESINVELNNECKDDFEEDVASPDTHDNINSNLTLRMVKRLQQSLAPNPKQEYVSEIIKTMLTELEKDINLILERRRKMRNEYLYHGISDDTSLQKSIAKSREKKQKNEILEKPFGGVIAQSIHFTQIQTCKYKININEKCSRHQVKLSKAKKCQGEEHTKPAKQYVVNLTICNGKLSVITGGGHVDIIEYLQKKLQL